MIIMCYVTSLALKGRRGSPRSNY